MQGNKAPTGHSEGSPLACSQRAGRVAGWSRSSTERSTQLKDTTTNGRRQPTQRAYGATGEPHIDNMSDKKGWETREPHVDNMSDPRAGRVAGWSPKQSGSIYKIERHDGWKEATNATSIRGDGSNRTLTSCPTRKIGR